MRKFLNLSVQKGFKLRVKRLDGVLYAEIKQSKNGY